MKKRILLIDESLTVQKVVALTLDREKMTVTNAKSRSEAMKIILEAPPDVILVSDQVTGLSASSFPKEVETWVGRDRRSPPLILVTSHDVKEQRGYASVLKKPFAPQLLQSCVSDALVGAPEERDDARMERAFSDAFSNESDLVNETFKAEIEDAEATLLTIAAPSKDLWSNQPTVPSKAAPKNVKGDAVEVMSTEDSMQYKAQLEKEVRLALDSHDLEDIVARLLEKIVPPIVERLAQQRLDQLLKESESFVELKP